MSTSRLKKEILELLEKDVEFRYAVAGYLGLLELLKRMDKHETELIRLREDLNRLRKDMIEGFKRVNSSISRLSTTVERLTLTVEEEAIEVIRHRLKNELGIGIKLTRIFIDDKEINIYGATSELCIVGEATVRLGIRLIDELEEKIRIMKDKKPELLRSKIIKVIYADYALPNAIEEAKRRKIWLLKWSGDLTPREILEL